MSQTISRYPTVPAGKIDVVLDTDAYNEIDDQYAISYLLSYGEKLNILGLYAAPFFNSLSVSPADGMEKSYQELKNLLVLAKREELLGLIKRGSTQYLPDERTPVESEAVDALVALAEAHSPEAPLYVVAIGAITNVASALLKSTAVRDNCVIVWLGGHGVHVDKAASEFNMRQDIAAARVVLGSGAPLVLLPCRGVVDHLTTTKYELAHWLEGKNPLCDYLYRHTVEAAESYAAGKPWSRVIWDVTAVAWLVNEGERFMKGKPMPAPVPEYDQRYAADGYSHLIHYIYQIQRDALFEDLFRRLAQ